MIGELLEVIAEIGTWFMSWRAFLWIVLVFLIIVALYRALNGASLPPAVLFGIVGVAGVLILDWCHRR